MSKIRTDKLIAFLKRVFTPLKPFCMLLIRVFIAVILFWFYLVAIEWIMPLFGINLGELVYHNARIIFPDNARMQELYQIYVLFLFEISAYLVAFGLAYAFWSAERTKKRISDLESKKGDIYPLIFDNLLEIRDYYTISKRQVSLSFVLAICLCLCGFCLVGVAALSAVFQTGNVAATLIPAIGAVVVEVIAGTTLLVYRRTLDQLNLYYASLNKNQQFLLAINMCDKLPDEKRDSLYREVIMKYLECDRTVANAVDDN